LKTLETQYRAAAIG